MPLIIYPKPKCLKIPFTKRRKGPLRVISFTAAQLISTAGSAFEPHTSFHFFSLGCFGPTFVTWIVLDEHTEQIVFMPYCLFINREWCCWGDFMLPTTGVLHPVTWLTTALLHARTHSGVQIWLLYIQIIHHSAMSAALFLSQPACSSEFISINPDLKQ